MQRLRNENTSSKRTFLTYEIFYQSPSGSTNFCDLSGETETPRSETNFDLKEIFYCGEDWT